ncbi:MAG TPA: hypothetical protein VFM34_01815 [Moraxellaceae bacterium]|nr:hypothetical protein [Moraxellaceae bacterium]
MRLADLRLAVRPRRPYEAVDLGIRLVQDDAALIWRTWLAVSLPFLVIAWVAILFFEIHSASFLLWWLKPLFDQALLIVLSRRVFGDALGTSNVLRLLASGFRHGLVGNLLWRRFSLSRAYQLPVWLLESVPAKERRARLTLLGRQYAGRAQWLQLVMMHFELVLGVAVLSMIFWLAPDGATPDLWASLSGQSRHPFAEAGTLLAWYVGMSIVEPFYVAAGFSLYLNRRTELEAWDIELAFRRLRERLDTGKQSA